MRRLPMLLAWMLVTCRRPSIERVTADDVAPAASDTPVVVALVDADPADDGSPPPNPDWLGVCDFDAAIDTKDWVSGTLRDFTFLYPKKIFTRIVKTPTRITLSAPSVFAHAMDGAVFPCTHLGIEAQRRR